MIRQYEALLLTVPEITGDEVKHLETQLDKTIKAATGSTISFERWGKYKLALLKVKLNNIIVRDMVSVLDPKRPLTYQRPRSLEEAPAREADSFSKDKMPHFLANDDRDEIDED